MSRLTPGQMMFIGFVLLAIGILLPFLMVLRIIEPTLLLNFVAYFTSFIGLVIGVAGVVSYGRVQQGDGDENR